MINSRNIQFTASPKNIFDETTCQRMVAARLDLPITQKLLSEKFLVNHSTLLGRSTSTEWYDLFINLSQIHYFYFYLGDDFVSNSDLKTACMILQKQIECINGNKET